MDVITSRVEYRSSLFIKTVFEATFSFSNILYITQATLNQIDNVKSFTSDMRFDVVGLTRKMKSVLITAMFNIGTGSGCNSCCCTERNRGWIGSYWCRCC